jgi:hypothetical protein
MLWITITLRKLIKMVINFTVRFSALSHEKQDSEIFTLQEEDTILKDFLF